MMGKGGPGGESPERLLPDKDNRSDRREKATSMPSGFFIGNSTPERQRQLQMQYDLQHVQHAQSQPPSSQGTLTMFGIVSSPIHHNTSSHGHQHQHVHHPATVTTGMIPLSPLIPMPYTAAAHGIDNAASVSGIIPLANFTCNPCNTPPAGRKLTFNPRSPKISPHHSVVQTPVPPPLRHPQQQLLQQLPCLTYPCQQQQQQQERGIHHFDRVDGQPRMPWMVPALVVIHSLIFITVMFDNDCPHNSLTPQRCVIKFLGRLSFQPLNENPLLGPSNKALLSMGALQPDLVTSGQGWRLLTNIWLHAGLFHLLANMIGLLSIGLVLEKDFGWVRVATIYLVAGFGGSLLSALFLQNQISVGASGALMGLLGSTVAEILVNWSTYHHRKRSLAVLLLAIAVNLSFGLMPHVDNFAHVGGLSAGLLLGFIFLRRPRFAWVNQMVHDIDSEGAQQQRSRSSSNRMIKHTRLQTTVWFIALSLLLVCYGTAMLALFKGYGLEARKSCKWCQYMTCVPIFEWQCHHID